jgi:hypothetical protein
MRLSQSARSGQSRAGLAHGSINSLRRSACAFCAGVLTDYQKSFLSGPAVRALWGETVSENGQLCSIS